MRCAPCRARAPRAAASRPCGAAARSGPTATAEPSPARPPPPPPSAGVAEQERTVQVLDPARHRRRPRTRPARGRRRHRRERTAAGRRRSRRRRSRLKAGGGSPAPPARCRHPLASVDDRQVGRAGVADQASRSGSKASSVPVRPSTSASVPATRPSQRCSWLQLMPCPLATAASLPSLQLEAQRLDVLLAGLRLAGIGAQSGTRISDGLSRMSSTAASTRIS
jgi:hypothetical protein